jgi:uncharacterized protein YbjQ (UPF0145 family)
MSKKEKEYWDKIREDWRFKNPDYRIKGRLEGEEMRTVFKNIVQSRNFVSDFGATIKNIVGGRLKTYEKMMDEEID